MELCGLKVKIGLRNNGEADHPDFSVLPCVQGSGLNWSKYIDSPQYGDGAGWHYDKSSGHKEHSDDSPMGQQWAMLIINEEFCEQACAAFPTICSHMTEAECQTFLETKATAHLPEAKRDADALNGRVAEITLIEKLIANEKDAVKKAAHQTRLAKCLVEAEAALDPESKMPGVRKTEGKTWADHKAKKQIAYKELAKE